MEDAPAVLPTTSTALALRDFFLMSHQPYYIEPGSQPALLVLPPLRAGASFIYIVTLKLFIDCKPVAQGLFQTI